MADFGDDVGDMLIRHTDDFIRRLIQYRQKAAKGQNETESKSSSITIQGEKVSSLSERTEFTFSEKDFDAVKGVVSQSVNGRGSHEASAPEQHPVYMRDIEKIVDDALSKTQDPQQFIALCREQGLEVGQAADGTLKFTHSNGWFECRADTLFERMENGMNREDFERGVGEKAEDLSQHVVEEQERYIKSHDSQDLDTSTRVVEQPEKVKADRSAKEQDKGYDLNSEARDMRAASKALDTDRAAKEVAPQER